MARFIYVGRCTNLSFSLACLDLHLQKMSIGEYKNIDVSDRQNRNKLFVFVGFVMILFLATLLLIEMPLTVLLPYLMAVIAIVIGIITTRLFAKISFHGIASAGSTFLLLSTPYFLPFLLLSMGSGWSRMELGRHTKNEVVLGYIVGSFVTILMLFIFY